MSGHTYTHTHTHTYTHDNYYNPRCAHAYRGLMNKEVGMLLPKKELINNYSEDIYIPPYNTH